MLLEDYLNKTVHFRRILIVSDPAAGQALIRMHEKKTGGIVRNVSCMSVGQMANMLYKYFLAANNANEEFEFLDGTEAMMLFRSVLFKNKNKLLFFNNEKMQDIATTREIFNKAELIRVNGWNGNEKYVKNDRVADLKTLINEYEAKLFSDKLTDQTSTNKYVLEKLKSLKDINSEIHNAFPAEVSYLSEDVKYYNGVEKDLLFLLKNADDPAVRAYGDGTAAELLSGCKGKACFYKGYGSFNEASYISNDIFENKLPFGSVTVCFTSPYQIPAIVSALSGNGIPMKIVSDFSGADNPYISLAKRIIEWAEDDFAEKMLEKILASSVICVRGEYHGEDVNLLSSQRYFDHVLNARDRGKDRFVLGWGYERNAAFIIHEQERVNDDEGMKSILRMHESLLNIFADSGKPYDDKYKVRPIELYKKLTAFIEENTVRNADYAVGIDSLRKIARAVRFEERALPLTETLLFTKELLKGVTMSEKEDTAAVKVYSLGERRILDRSNVYVTGMALKDMQGNTTQSPVLSDDEMEDFLKNGYIPSVKNEIEKKEENILYTLNTFYGGRIVFGYSDYDTVGFCENNASAFYRELLSVLSTDVDMQALPEFVYGNPLSESGTEEESVINAGASFDVRLKTSSSSLEVLLDCPKKYVYEKLLGITDNKFSECDHGRWLDNRLKGIFFHSILEKYCNERLVRKVSETYETSKDAVYINKLAKQIENELLLEIPCAFRGLADRETEDMVREATTYIQSLTDELNESSWRVLIAELKFTEARYPVQSFEGKEYNFECTGYIDRIDYRIDRSAGKCFVRIIDYKTGSRDNKLKADEHGKLIQHAIYKKAVTGTGKTEDKERGIVPIQEYIRDTVAYLEEDDAVRDMEVEFEYFRYVFPMEKKTKEPADIYPEDLEGMNKVRLRSILTIIEAKHIFPDKSELKLCLNELAGNYQSDKAGIDELSEIVEANADKGDNCKYCSYINLCSNKKVGDIK